MVREEIVGKIEDFRELGIPSYIKRSCLLLQAELMISTVIGARRAGKSFRVIQAADELIEKKIISSIRHICHLDFDNPILAAMTAAELGSIPEIFLSITPEASLKTPLLFIFDELHAIDGWERFVIELSRNPHWKVMVTGSSSKLLRKDIATELRGKAIPTEVYPLAFKEFLSFKNIPVRFSTTGSAAIRGAFDEYLRWGSYPIIPRTEQYLRPALLREYFDTMLLKDIIERYNIGKPRQCIQLYHYLLSCMAKPVTVVSAHNFLKTAGEMIGRESVADWIEWAQDSWLFFSVPLFSDSLKAQEHNFKKLYAIDWALAHFNSRTWDGSLSRSLENAVYIHLVRLFPHVNYYLTRTGRQEVDFIVTDHQGVQRKLVQVCLDISEPATLQRELKPLVETARFFKTEETLIITLDQEKTIELEGIQVRVVPAWKWFCEE
jgi:predicted AAA+ superfamily ATPase